MDYGLTYYFCSGFCIGGGGVNEGGDYEPPLSGDNEQHTTPEQCGKLWEKCLQSGEVEKSKCDALKASCNNNWGNSTL